MSIKKGSTAIVDRYKGSQLVERVYKGQTKIFDAYTDVSGTLPLSFTARAQQALKNYRLHGTSEGVGEKTENLFDKDDKGAGYRDGCYLTNSSPYVAENSNWAISAYIPVTQGVTYVVWWSMYETISAAAPSIAFYASQHSSDRVSVTRYENRGHFLITAPSGAKYARISFYKANEDFTTFAPSDTMITEPIPYGYKIPLTVTSGEQSANYNLYIGSTKLGAEEYVDFQNQKIYKTKITWVCTVTTETNNRVRYQFKPTIDDADFASGVTGAGMIRLKNTVSYLRPETEGASVVEVPTDYASITTLGGYSTDEGNGTTAVAFLVVNGVYYYSDTLSYTYNYAYTNEPISLTNMHSNVAPTDPPSPLSAITAYEGEDTLSSTETVGSVTVTGRISEIPEP